MFIIIIVRRTAGVAEALSTYVHYSAESSQSNAKNYCSEQFTNQHRTASHWFVRQYSHGSRKIRHKLRWAVIDISVVYRGDSVKR